MGNAAGGNRLLEPQPGVSPLPGDEPGADHRVGDQEQDRPERPDRLPDLDDHEDLRDRHGHEHEQEHESHEAG